MWVWLGSEVEAGSPGYGFYCHPIVLSPNLPQYSISIRSRASLKAEIKSTFSFLGVETLDHLGDLVFLGKERNLKVFLVM